MGAWAPGKWRTQTDANRTEPRRPRHPKSAAREDGGRNNLREGLRGGGKGGPKQPAKCQAGGEGDRGSSPPRYDGGTTPQLHSENFVTWRRRLDRKGEIETRGAPGAGGFGIKSAGASRCRSNESKSGVARTASCGPGGQARGKWGRGKVAGREGKGYGKGTGGKERATEGCNVMGAWHAARCSPGRSRRCL